MRRQETLASLLAAALMLGGLCALPSAAGEPAANRTNVPSVSRGTIDYLRSIDSVREYAKPKSFLGKLVEWVAGRAETPQLLRPYGVTQDSVGRLIVADPGQQVVHIFDFEERKYDSIRGAKREEFRSPIGVATDADDNIYVSDSARARIYVYNKKGKFLRALGDPKQGVQLIRPTGLAIDPARRLIYLTDTSRHEVLVLTLDGKLVKTIGQRGTGPVEFNFPTALTLAKGELYVVDAMNFRIQVLTPEGCFVRSFGRLGDSSGTFNRPKGIAVDSDGNVYVVDALFEIVQIFSPEGRLLHLFGTTGRGHGQFVLPAGIYIDPRNIVYVADSYNRRVQVFRYRQVKP